MAAIKDGPLNDFLLATIVQLGRVIQRLIASSRSCQLSKHGPYQTRGQLATNSKISHRKLGYSAENEQPYFLIRMHLVAARRSCQLSTKRSSTHSTPPLLY